MDRAFLTDDPEAGQLILVRHGQQQWPDHQTATVGDWVDPPLSDLGRQQAAAVAKYLAEEPVTAVYSSQLKRAFDTGQAIAELRFIMSKRWDSYPHSETSEDFRRRVGIAVEAAIADHEGETVVVACHGGVINTYLAQVLGLDMDMFYRPVHTSVHRVRYKGSLRVIDSLNEQTFLRDQGLLSS
jgi:broad specificity phosphatase PhoE